MKNIRILLRDGILRRHVTVLISLVLYVAALTVSIINFNVISANIEALDKILRLFGFFSSLLAALSYKLRENNLAHYIKCLQNDVTIHNPIETGREVTILTLLSFIASGLLIITSCIPYNVLKICICSPLCISLCSVCTVQYIYLLFGIEKFEEEVIAALEESYVKKNTRR